MKFKDKQENIINLLQDSDIEYVSRDNDGYLKFANGALICYGYTIRNDNEGNPIPITFPKAFHAKPFIVATPVYNYDEIVYFTISGITTTGFGAYCNGANFGSTKSQDVYYIAIGKWK